MRACKLIRASQSSVHLAGVLPQLSRPSNGVRDQRRAHRAPYVSTCLANAQRSLRTSALACDEAWHAKLRIQFLRCCSGFTICACDADVLKRVGVTNTLPACGPTRMCRATCSTVPEFTCMNGVVLVCVVCSRARSCLRARIRPSSLRDTRANTSFPRSLQ